MNHSSLIKKAAEILKQGGLIGLPTETVYGLAADAKNETAIKKIFKAKGRPIDHPLIVHIGSITEVDEWAKEISPEATLLMQHFWPGPLTLILKKQTHVSDLITANQDSIGLRMPQHEMAQELLKTFGHGLVAPSANQFGHLSPTKAEDVLEELAHKVDLILPGGQTKIGIESTIVDARNSPLVILRQGAISKSMLEKVLGQKVLDKPKEQIKVSGNLLNHYAPRTPLLLLEHNELEKLIKKESRKIAVLTQTKIDLPSNCKGLTLGDTAQSYAHNLYETLRKADHLKVDLIVVEKPPEGELWDAIIDRLQKAAKK